MSEHQDSIAASPAITCLSSMATQHLLADAAAAWRLDGGPALSIESIGGIHAFKRVMDGEEVDLVVLSADAIDQLMAAGRLRPASRADIAVARLALAVRAGAPRPDVHQEDLLRRALLAARRIGLSTGASGTALRTLMTRLKLTERLNGRLVLAPPGVSVGTLVARGEVELGFQQLSELIHVDGIDIVSELPSSLDTATTFSGAVGAASPHEAPASAFLSWLCSPVTDELRQRHGMQRARSHRTTPLNDQPMEIRT